MTENQGIILLTTSCVIPIPPDFWIHRFCLLPLPTDFNQQTLFKDSYWLKRKTLKASSILEEVFFAHHVICSVARKL